MCEINYKQLGLPPENALLMMCKKKKDEYRKESRGENNSPVV